MDVSCQSMEVAGSLIKSLYSLMTPLGTKGSCQETEMEREVAGTTLMLSGGPDGARHIRKNIITC